MTRIAIEGAFEPIEVDFWGVLFETRAMPRSRARKARKIGVAIQKLADQNPEEIATEEAEAAGENLTDERVEAVADRLEEEQIALYGQLFDLKLQAAEGGRRKPSTLLRQKWDADDLTANGLATFLAKLMVAERQQMLEDVGQFAGDPVERPT